MHFVRLTTGLYFSGVHGKWDKVRLVTFKKLSGAVLTD